MTENDWNTTNQLAKLSFSNSAFPDQPSSNRSRLRAACSLYGAAASATVDVCGLVDDRYDDDQRHGRRLSVATAIFTGRRTMRWPTNVNIYRPLFSVCMTAAPYRQASSRWSACPRKQLSNPNMK